MSVGVIEVLDNKSTVRKLAKAERQTLIVVENFCDINVTSDADDPTLLEVSGGNDFIQQFGEGNEAGKKVFKKKVSYDDGEEDIVEIGKMADFDLEKLSQKSSVIAKLEKSKSILDDLKKIKTTSFIELLSDPKKIDELVTGLKEIKETINQTS